MHEIKTNLEQEVANETFESELSDEILSSEGPGVETEVHEIQFYRPNIV
jgi:hypothetical protein